MPATMKADAVSFEEILAGEGPLQDNKKTPSQWAEERRIYLLRLMEACELNKWRMSANPLNPLGEPGSYITAEEFDAGMAKVPLMRVLVIVPQNTKEFKGRFYIGRFFPWGQTICDVCKSELRELMVAQKDETLSVFKAGVEATLSPPPTDSKPVDIPEGSHPERAAVKASEPVERVLRDEGGVKLSSRMVRSRE